MITLLKQLSAHRKFIIRIIASAAIISLVVSLLLPVYYESTTIFYAANESLAAPQAVGGTDRDYYIYGDDDDRDRLLSVANGGEVKDFLIDKFDLYTVYDIDSSKRRGPYEVRIQLDDLYKVQKNEFGGIDISVEDVDRYRAADMANAARDKVSSIVQAMIKGSQKKMISNITENVAKKDTIINTKDEELQKLREQYSIYDTETQGSLFAELLTSTNANINQVNGKLAMKGSVPRDSIRKWQALLRGLETKKSELVKDLDQYNKGLSQVMKIEQELARYTSQYNVDKERLNQLLATYEAPFTALHVVETAGVPVVKSRPKKAIIILAATFITALLAVLFVLIREAFKQVPWDEVLQSERA